MVARVDFESRIAIFLPSFSCQQSRRRSKWFGAANGVLTARALLLA
jgi:hypothetical protein